MRHFLLLSTTVIVTAFFTSCLDNQYDKDIEIIEKYISSHQLDTADVVIDDHGMYYIELQEGSGFYAEAGDSIVFAYSMRLEDNVEVASASVSEPIGAYLNRLVTGLQLGIPYMKAGGEAVILMPSYLGYGQFGMGTDGESNYIILTC
ncbi:MAG: FKBP-type peptidyl-prolyl cis-trans isomerase [Bacteroidales bacterium]|nr:FKBP-type peptidyl-prolyl cis-trans isomerase [Bacteroidales bacterium]